MIDLTRVKQICIDEARKSDCLKMGFGVVAFAENKQCHLVKVASAHNKRLPALSEFCDGEECIRNHIPSRTQSLLGACAHAEERVIWQLIHHRRRIKLHTVRLYVAGVNPDGVPYIKMGNEWTCLRCAIIMHFAGIYSVNFWNEGELVSIKPKDAVKQAVGFALGQKSWETRVEFPEIDVGKRLRFLRDVD